MRFVIDRETNYMYFVLTIDDWFIYREHNFGGLIYLADTKWVSVRFELFIWRLDASRCIWLVE